MVLRLSQEFDSERLTFQIDDPGNMQYLLLLDRMQKWVDEQQPPGTSVRVQDRHDRSYGPDLIGYLGLNAAHAVHQTPNVEVEHVCLDQTNETPEDLEQIATKAAQLEAARQEQIAIQKVKDLARKVRESFPKEHPVIPVLQEADSLNATNCQAVTDAYRILVKAHATFFETIDAL